MVVNGVINDLIKCSKEFPFLELCLTFHQSNYYVTCAKTIGEIKRKNLIIGEQEINTIVIDEL